MVHERECSAIVMLTAPLEEQQVLSSQLNDLATEFKCSALKRGNEVVSGALG